ncbi:hypothetical protein [Burkholderia sp. Bp8986]|uniref:hypothetical protein n=1 Tax=Burkholderia sp. Bp8986 TaxID=2184550 RepID=UPI0021AB634B|nr:hypothetical protein [Burkholderia sp. Bp8986]
MPTPGAELPPEMMAVREAVLAEMEDLVPAGPPVSHDEVKRFFLSSWTEAGRDLPPYYLVYFLLIDLLGFPHLGQWEKVDWAIPVRLRGKLYGVEHRKMGIGIFAPNPDPSATRSTKPDEEAEKDASEMCRLLKRAVTTAEPYFEWRARTAAKGPYISVVNRSAALFERYRFFRRQFEALSSEALLRRDETTTPGDGQSGHKLRFSHMFPGVRLREEAEWSAQAAIEAFFSWTEHVFIHLAILLGRVENGEEVAKLAEADWKTKFRAALDIDEPETKVHYDSLLTLRTQIRNFMAHGSFGKRGEAFSFHSGAGAVPVLLTRNPRHRYSLTGGPEFDEKSALQEIELFIAHLWSGTREPARECMESELPTVLTYATDGTYARVMRSVGSMRKFVERMRSVNDVLV